MKEKKIDRKQKDREDEDTEKDPKRREKETDEVALNRKEKKDVEDEKGFRQHQLQHQVERHPIKTGETDELGASPAIHSRASQC